MVAEMKKVPVFEEELIKVRLSRDTYLKDKIFAESLNVKLSAELVESKAESRDLAIKLEKAEFNLYLGIGGGALFTTLIMILLN
jgi:hypothetical protein